MSQTPPVQQGKPLRRLGESGNAVTWKLTRFWRLRTTKRRKKTAQNQKLIGEEPKSARKKKYRYIVIRIRRNKDHGYIKNKRIEYFLFFNHPFGVIFRY